MPQDIIEHTYEAHGGAAELMLCNDPEVLFEGAAGTGKTRAVLHKIADLCEAYPRTRALICRATRVSCTESILVTLERDVIPDGFPWIHKDASRAHRDSYECVNGSVIVVGGLDHPEKLYSTEWDIVYVAEAIDINEDAWEKFARAMRNKGIPKGIGGGPQQDGEDRALEPHPGTGEMIPAFWTQRIADCNPGAPSHWLNQRGHRKQIARIRSRHEDNPSITEDFLRGLRSLTGHRRARLYEGLWKAAEGSVFPQFNDEPETGNVWHAFNPPADWPLYFGTDPGVNHPWANLWFTVAPTGELIVCGEVVVEGKGTDEVVPLVREMERARGWDAREITRYGDPQYCFSATAHSGTKETIAEQWQRLGLILHPWPRTGDNMDGMVDAVRTRINARTLILMDNCPKAIAATQSWSFRRNADGTPAGAKGKDAYEEEYKDPCDVIRGIVALNPGHRGLSIRQLSQTTDALQPVIVRGRKRYVHGDEDDE